jgi:hypothetical protein
LQQDWGEVIHITVVAVRGISDLEGDRLSLIIKDFDCQKDKILVANSRPILGTTLRRFQSHGVGELLAKAQGSE